MITKKEFNKARLDKSIPFRIRAGIINAFRKERINGIQNSVHEKLEQSSTSKAKSLLSQAKNKEESQRFSKADKVFHARKHRRKRLPKRIILPKLPVCLGTRHNYVKVNSLKLIIELTSKGKNRPTRKKKYHFKTMSRTLHLKGNRYNGGSEWPT